MAAAQKGSLACFGWLNPKITAADCFVRSGIPGNLEPPMGEPNTALNLQQLYQNRFGGMADYRQRVWVVLSQFFSQWISSEAQVLDLGCGWCEFINAVSCRVKFAMDLNPDSKRFAKPEVRVLEQDCSAPWALPSEALDAVFTSNFLEHLPTKSALE